jgi:hypothetical protein
MRNPNDLERPMVMLPVKYIDEIKWIQENRLSFWKHIDKVYLKRTPTDFVEIPTDFVNISNLS